MSGSGEDKSILIHVRLQCELANGFGRNLWYLLKPTDGGPEISQLLADQPLDIATSIVLAGCQSIGSHLYIICGVPLLKGGMDGVWSREVRRLDSLNPAEGWKTISSLKYPWRRPGTVVVGDYIYLFGGHPPFFFSCAPPVHMYCFNVTETSNEGYRVYLPPGLELEEFDECPLVLPVPNGKGRLLAFFYEYKMACVHDPQLGQWVTDPKKLDVPNFCGPVAVWEQIVFYCDLDAEDGPRLYAYDLVQCCLLLDIEFSLSLDGLRQLSINILPVTREKLCFVWRDCDAKHGEGLPLCYGEALIDYEGKSATFGNVVKINPVPICYDAHLENICTVDPHFGEVGHSTRKRSDLHFGDVELGTAKRMFGSEP